MARSALAALLLVAGAGACARDATGARIIVTITGIAPLSGPVAGGTVISVTGTNFPATASIASVSFGGVDAPSFSVTDATNATVTTPPHTAGVVNIVVHLTSGDSATLVNAFTFTGAVTITGVSPASGPIAGGTAIAISGSSFLPGALVTVGSTSATAVSVANSGLINATTPAGTPGATSVSVQNPDGQNVTAANAFTYFGPPVITSVSPASGPTSGGTTITIAGSGFRAGAAVAVGNQATTGVTVTASSISAITPANTAGSKDVLVQNPDGQNATATGAFSYVALPAPVISSISPTSGPTAGGTAIVITGSAFQSGASVTVGGTAATGITITATQINATTPPGTAGAKNLVVQNPDGQSATAAGAFTYIPPPVIASSSPASGPPAGGTAITITGSGFQAGATVSVGGAAATGVTVTATQITASTPAGTAGSKNLVVQNPDGQSATVVAGFTYTGSVAPVLTSISRVAGSTAGGAVVQLNGSSFVNGAVASFGGTNATTTFVSSTVLQASVPAHAAGVANVTVTQTGLTSTLSNVFEYVLAPTTTYLDETFETSLGAWTVENNTGQGNGSVSTDFAFAGTKSAKLNLTTDNQSRLRFRYSSPSNPPSGKWYFKRFYVLLTQGDLTNWSPSQMKISLNRYSSGGVNGWLEFGYGAAFYGSAPTTFVALEEAGNSTLAGSRTGITIVPNVWYEVQIAMYQDNSVGHVRMWLGTGGSLTKYMDVTDVNLGTFSASAIMDSVIGIAFVNPPNSLTGNVYVDNTKEADGFIDP